MKKIILCIFIFLIFPINILAYSSKIIPGGENIGIKINSKGLVVVGFYKVNGEYIGKKSLKVGDTILKVNNRTVNSINDVTNVIENSINEGSIVPIVIKRNNKLINTNLNVILDNNIYKTGLYIKDSISGIGTLTYIDPITKIYGALGHEISFSETNTIVEVRNGYILESMVTSIDRSSNGKVGSKNASINYNNKLGTILKNTNYGIYGKIKEIPNKDTIEVAEFNEIEEGLAYIYTVTSKDNITKYSIDILDIYYNKKDSTKSFGFEITDKKLLKKTGGVVQGMSGSPIIQNNKIIGGVTHVLVDNVILGYGIYIKTMLEEGEKY